MQIFLEGNFMKFLMRLPCRQRGKFTPPQWRVSATVVTV